jgi:beta-glucosidase
MLNPLTSKTWGSEDPCRMFPAPTPSALMAISSVRLTVFGGALPWEIGDISFTGMAAAKSRSMYPTLADIKAIMTEIGDPKKVILSIYFRAPYVMDDASGLKNAGAILATFGVTDTWR